MLSSKVLIISAITGTHGPDQAEQVNIVLRHLTARGNDVILYDFSAANNEQYDIEMLKKQLNTSGMVESVDAIVLITDEYCAYLTQVLQGLFKVNSKKLKRSSNVWFHNGVCCTILGGSVKKSRVAKQLWEVFSEQNELDLTDIFPYGSPRSYVLDYTKETAQPTVV
ncbi:uncharacterized protein [Clytia hemisphaerica]|uniref:Uncharacterized protein n=1 Tax=Clytia hemisphaerica TaxID=252671 RepID=A0A7M6DNA7_9CNID|eukprot:TCONS_00017231-protein